jgi:hypothetical protein
MHTLSRQCYELYLDDDRYAVPTLHLIVTDDPASARRTAERLLSQSGHHHGGELWGDGRRLARFPPRGSELED